MIERFLEGLRPLLPALLLAAAPLLLPLWGRLAERLPEFAQWLPYLALLLVLIPAWLFHRGRAGLTALALILGGWSLGQTPPLGQLALLLVPLALALVNWLPERDLLGTRGMLRLVLLAAAAAGAYAASEPLQALLHRTLLPAALPWLSDAQWLTLGLAGLALLVRLLWRRQALDGAALGALAALPLAALAPGGALYLLLAGLALLLGLTLDSHRLAYRDELTGLPGRRALNERLAGLGRRYTIAMLDVDHFKRFNDRHGHEVGDQVLRMVAARLRRVGGGGRAYRYGGEEFTVLFPRRALEAAEPHLDELRQAVADYRLRLRGRDRPSGRGGKKRRGSGGERDSVAVTISIGLAQRGGELRRPEQVLQAADQALYRAKRAGRNRVSR